MALRLNNEPMLIIGAGLGGLALAQGLKKAGISFKVFERDHTINYRPQGYRIRLHGEGSFAGLRANLSNELWTFFEKTCPETRLGPVPNINARTGDMMHNTPFGAPCGASSGPGGGVRGPLKQMVIGNRIRLTAAYYVKY